nr:MAG TPA: hypothetical protein [Bacteriophage sp.]
MTAAEKVDAYLDRVLCYLLRYDAIKTVLEGGKTHDRSRES